MTHEPTTPPTMAHTTGAAATQPFCEGGCTCGAVRYRVTSAPMMPSQRRIIEQMPMYLRFSS